MERLTRDDARAAFASAGLTHAVVTRVSLQRLRTLINQRMIAGRYMQGTLRCRQRGELRVGRAALKCKAFYFDDREAVTFNSDGFIGFAGWASDENVQPILAGFIAWVGELQEKHP
jgi:hypothetical protein